MENDTVNANVLEQFLEFINEGDLGCTLFETDQNFKNPQKISLENGEVKEDNCNN